MESGGVCEDEENKGSAGRVRLSSSTLFTDELISVLSPPSSKHDDFNFPIATGIGNIHTCLYNTINQCIYGYGVVYAICLWQNCVYMLTIIADNSLTCVCREVCE